MKNKIKNFLHIKNSSALMAFWIYLAGSFNMLILYGCKNELPPKKDSTTTTTKKTLPTNDTSKDKIDASNELKNLNNSIEDIVSIEHTESLAEIDFKEIDKNKSEQKNIYKSLYGKYPDEKFNFDEYIKNSRTECFKNFSTPLDWHNNKFFLMELFRKEGFNQKTGLYDIKKEYYTYSDRSVGMERSYFETVELYNKRGITPTIFVFDKNEEAYFINTDPEKKLRYEICYIKDALHVIEEKSRFSDWLKEKTTEITFADFAYLIEVINKNIETNRKLIYNCVDLLRMLCLHYLSSLVEGNIGKTVTYMDWTANITPNMNSQYMEQDRLSFNEMNVNLEHVGSFMENGAIFYSASSINSFDNIERLYYFYYYAMMILVEDCKYEIKKSEDPILKKVLSWYENNKPKRYATNEEYRSGIELLINTAYLYYKAQKKEGAIYSMLSQMGHENSISTEFIRRSNHN